MKITAPAYYKSFKCIAGKCKHSCCIGWEIDIDEDTIDKYKIVKGPIGEKLKNSIRFQDGTYSFILSDNERCPFLNSNNLCDIYIELGEENLCQICTDHPRFRNYFSDRTEVGIGLCCEAAGKIILSDTTGFSEIILSDDGEKEYLSEDEKYIIDLRKNLILIIQNNKNNIEDGIKLMLDYADIIYRDKTISQWISVLKGLEILDLNWKKYLDRISGFSDKMTQTSEIGFNTQFANLISYFLYRYLPDAVNYSDLTARICFAVLGYKIIKTLCLSDILTKGKCEFEDLVEFARMYSSEIEYSQENTDRILDIYIDEILFKK